MSGLPIQRRMVMAVLALAAGTALALGVDSVVAQSDEELVPVVRVQPVYPARALQRDETGAVALRFTINAGGRTKDIEVIESSSRTFEQPAIDAVRKWRYAPQTENGNPVERRGVQTVLRFNRSDRRGLLPSESASR